MAKVDNNFLSPIMGQGPGNVEWRRIKTLMEIKIRSTP